MQKDLIQENYHETKFIYILNINIVKDLARSTSMILTCTLIKIVIKTDVSSKM